MDEAAERAERNRGGVLAAELKISFGSRVSRLVFERFTPILTFSVKGEGRAREPAFVLLSSKVSATRANFPMTNPDDLGPERIYRGDAEYAEKRILSSKTSNSATSVSWTHSAAFSKE
jgi:hypothetical protein